MDYSRYERIKVDRRGRILDRRLAGPETLNAVDQRMHDELATIFYDVQLYDQTDVIVMTGAGSAFSAGGDINWLAATAQAGGSGHLAVDAKRIVLVARLRKAYHRSHPRAPRRAWRNHRSICDATVMPLKAQGLGDPHAQVGLVAGDGGAVIWPTTRRLCQSERNILMTGDLIPAREAERIAAD